MACHRTFKYKFFKGPVDRWVVVFFENVREDYASQIRTSFYHIDFRIQ